MKKLDFAVYYDITEFAKEIIADYDSYEKIYICVDTWDFWIVRIQKDMNEEYEVEEGVWLLERNKIEKEFKTQEISCKSHLQEILEEDDLSNWDMLERHSLEECIECIDNGFGIKTIEE